MDRSIKLLLPTLVLALGLREMPLCAQPMAMPATVITPSQDSTTLGAASSQSTLKAKSSTQSADFSESVESTSGVSQAAYDQPIYPGPQSPYAAVPYTPSPYGPPAYGPPVQPAPGYVAPEPPRGLADPAGIMQGPAGFGEPWSWQIMPDGVIYHNYLADQEEPRFASQNVYDRKYGWFWDVTLGGQVALLRFGSQDSQYPEGWEADMEGAVFPRLDATRSLVSADYRFALPFTYRQGPWETRFGYSHLSSHLGDIYMEEHPGVDRINYIREQIILGIGYRPIPDFRLYGEASYAFHYDGGGQPWEFKFGAEFSPAQQTGIHGAPFMAVNVDLREDVDYSGNVTGELGWQWRGASGHLFRVGAQGFSGYSDQRQFYHQYENYFGGGIWYDY